jgi:methylated-DNA-[protein]-cysteine S-methyltransferase
VQSPVGALALTVRGERLTEVGFGPHPGDPAGDHPLLDETERQLSEYFACTRARFDLPLAPPAEGLLGAVLGALAEVP